jgi:hypothetical protein
MMNNRVSGTGAGSISLDEQTTLQNAGSPGSRLKLALLWLAVLLPLSWGIMHAMDGALVSLPY